MVQVNLKWGHPASWLRFRGDRKQVCSAPLIPKVVQKVAARLLQAEQRRKQKQQKVENPQKKVPPTIRDPSSHVPREPSADP